jgi:hypothetical protein
MGGPRKTMRDIKTLSGRVDRIANPYMAYMQVTCLEMEKVRKGHERASALQRLESLNARICEIDSEKAAILRALSERDTARASETTDIKASGRPASARGGGGLRLRY